MLSLLEIPPHLKLVAALPYEIFDTFTSCVQSGLFVCIHCVSEKFTHVACYKFDKNFWQKCY